MVMSMYSLLEENASPDIEDIHRCLQGNLCRCTGYRPILEGFETFSKKGRRPNISEAGPGEEVLGFNADELKPFVSTSQETESNLVEICRKSLIHISGCGITGSDWYRPGTLAQLMELQGKLDDFELYGGGTGGYKTHKRRGTFPVIQISDLEELKTVTITATEISIGSTLTLTEALQMVRSKANTSSTVSAFLEVLSSVASQQVRNMATVGGCIMWRHACSDLMPFLLATRCKVEVLIPAGSTTTITINADFVEKGLPSKAIIASLHIPLSGEEWTTQFYRRSRRKEFDLAVANACMHAKLQSGVILEIAVAFGGAESNLPGAKMGKATLALGLMAGLKGKSRNAVTDVELKGWILGDPNIIFDSKAPGDYMRLRQALLVSFVRDFLDGQRQPKNASLPCKSTLTYQSPESGQPVEDPVTRPLAHLWAAEQATGEAVYVDDIKPLANELQIALVRSTRPHAKVTGIDFSKALQADGILGTVSHADLPGDRNLWGLVVRDEAIFAGEEVLYHGQIIAGLVCTTAAAGREAVALVEIRYEDLPPILSIKAAMEAKSFITSPMHLVRDQGAAAVPTVSHNVKGSIHIGGQEAFYMEPHSVLVVPSGEKEDLTIYHSTQEPSVVQTKVAETLGIAQHKIIVKVKRVGGAFGGKERMHNAIIAAVAAWKFRRPVRLIFTRKEDMEVTGHRHEAIVEYDIDYDDRGQLLRTDFNCHVNAGCSTDLSVIWARELILRMHSGYTLKRFSAKSTAYKTNTASNTALRGFAGPEASIVIEHVMERVAKNLQLDPLSVRLINMTKDGDLLHYGDTITTGCTLARCWEECKTRGQYLQKREAVNKFNSNVGSRVKRGLSMVPMKFAPTFGAKVPHQGTAFVRIYRDGSVLLSHGGIEMGQGLNTKMVQVASRALGVTHEKIHIMDTSTETSPNASPTGGSTGSDINGPAVIKACEILSERLEPFKMSSPAGNWEEWVEKAYIARVNLSAVGFYDWSEVDMDFDSNKGRWTDYWTYGVGLCQVEVDCTLGDVTIISADLVMDVGRSLNPAIDIGQIEGSFVQAQGYVTTEQLLLDPKTGELVTDGPGLYKLPTVADIPRELNVHLIRYSHGPASACYSSKGVGEPPFVLATAGIVMAIREAVESHRRDRGDDRWFEIEVPATADKIRAAAMGEDICLSDDKIAVEM